MKTTMKGRGSPVPRPDKSGALGSLQEVLHYPSEPQHHEAIELPGQLRVGLFEAVVAYYQHPEDRIVGLGLLQKAATTVLNSIPSLTPFPIQRLSLREQKIAKAPPPSPHPRNNTSCIRLGRWDHLSEIPLARNTLRELNGRNAAASSPPTTLHPRTSPRPITRRAA
ncbi:hypothetical protein F5Y16DRAFT_117953 [Xylariaceae sp. FL0255]|nr:hypothetical protein F5Y16DRAFT_117953 [Xylariaceae sp. FL0255]